jgi:hypothetical protein
VKKQGKLVKKISLVTAELRDLPGKSVVYIRGPYGMNIEYGFALGPKHLHKSAKGRVLSYMRRYWVLDMKTTLRQFMTNMLGPKGSLPADRLTLAESIVRRIPFMSDRNFKSLWIRYIDGEMDNE